MNSVGIETGTHYTPIHEFSLYKHQRNNLTITENISKSEEMSNILHFHGDLSKLH